MIINFWVFLFPVQWITELTTSTAKVPPCTYSVIYLQCGEAWAFVLGWANVLTHLCKQLLTTKLLAVFLDTLTEHRVSNFAFNLTSWSSLTSARLVNESSGDQGGWSAVISGAGIPADGLDLISPVLLVIVCASVIIVDYEVGDEYVFRVSEFFIHIFLIALIILLTVSLLIWAKGRKYLYLHFLQNDHIKI